MTNPENSAPQDLDPGADETFRLLVQSVSDYALFLLDSQGRVVSWNPGAERIKGYPAGEILGKPLSSFYPPEAQAAGEAERALNIASAEGRYAFEGWRVRKDGTRFWADVVLTALRGPDGALRGYAEVTRDRTQKKWEEERFRVAVESAPNAMVIINREGRIVLANAQAERMFGYSRPDLLGRSVEILVPHRFRARHPADRETFFRNPATRSMGAGRDLYGLRRDGTEIPVEIGLNPIRTDEGDFVLAAIVDITERKRAEERFRMAVESAPNAMVMVNAEGDIVLVNAQTEKLFGYGREELLGRSVEILVPRRFRDRHPGYRGGFFAQPQARAMGAGRDLYGVRKDGTEVPVEIGLNPIRTDEGEFVLAAIVDITERKRAEHAVRRMNEELEARVADRTRVLQDTVQELETFTYSVAHDLRAPLRAMHQFCDLLIEDHAGQLDETGAQYLRRVAAGAERMDRLIEDLLAYSRIPRSELHPEPLETRKVIADVLEEMGEVLRASGARIEVDPTLAPVHGDRVLLAQAIRNLVGNAVKFVPPDRAPIVRISSERVPGGVRLWVEDNGIGVDPKYAGRLFRVFERLQEAKPFPGTGVGLAIVRKAAERMGGRVGFEPVRGGRGTRFWIEVPAGKEDPSRIRDRP